MVAGRAVDRLGIEIGTSVVEYCNSSTQMTAKLCFKCLLILLGIPCQRWVYSAKRRLGASSSYAAASTLLN